MQVGAPLAGSAVGTVAQTRLRVRGRVQQLEQGGRGAYSGRECGRHLVITDRRGLARSAARRRCALPEAGPGRAGARWHGRDGKSRGNRVRTFGRRAERMVELRDSADTV